MVERTHLNVTFYVHCLICTFRTGILPD
jgi:hypothetical protein